MLLLLDFIRSKHKTKHIQYFIMVKKIFKYLFIFIMGLVLALLVAPFVFKDKILAEVKKQISNNVNATVDFKDVDVSFLKSFPEVSISLSDLKVIGVDTFADIELVKAKKIDLDFSLLPFFNKSMPMSLKYLGLENGDINIIKLSDTVANYLITKPSSDTSKFNMALEKYALVNSNLTYHDHSLPVKVLARKVNHNGTGDLSTDIFDLETSTTVDSLTVIFDGFTYLKNIKGALDANINMNFLEQKFTLKDNSIKLNKVEATGDGFVQFVNADDMKVKASFDAKNQSFGNIMSILPYLSAYNTAKADGNASIKGSVDGIYNGIKGVFPAFDLTLNVDKGSAQYAGLPNPIKDVFADVYIKSTRSDMKDLQIDIKNFSAAVGNEKMKGNFSIKDGMTDPHIKGNVSGDIHLENWATALPMTDVQQVKGQIKGNVEFDARQSDIDKENYSAIKFDGQFNANNILYHMKDKAPITIANAAMSATPQQIKLSTSGMQLGKSDMSLDGSLQNPMAYFSDNKNVKGNINLTSNLLDLNEWASSASSGSTTSTMAPDISAYKFSEVETKFSIGKILYGNHTVTNVAGEGKLGLENIDVKNFKASMDDSDIKFSGKLANVYSYLFSNEILVGDLNLYSNKFDANKYMTQSTAQPGAADSLLFLVPPRTDLTIKTTIDELTYTNMNLKNFTGTTTIKDEAILLSGLTANTLGGKIAFDGLYNTKNTKPTFNVKLDLAKMEFLKTYEKFITMKKLAPLANYIQGVFNTTLVMEGELGKGMTPDLSTISASGFLETLNGFIKGFKPLQLAGDKLGIAQLSNLEIKDTRNWFDIKKGVVEIKEFTKNIAGIDIKMAGKHKIQGAMDYNFFLRIPRAMLKKNVVTGTAEKGLSFLEKEAAKKGINIAQGEFIDLRVDIGGMLSSPTVSVVPLGTSGKSMQEEIKDEVKAQAEKAKDSITKVVNNKVNQVKDTIRNRADQELEKAKKKAEEKATEVINDAKNKAQKEVEKKLDTLVGKAVSDSLSKKAGQIIKDKTGKDVDDIKNKVKDWNPFKKKKSGGG